MTPARTPDWPASALRPARHDPREDYQAHNNNFGIFVFLDEALFLVLGSGLVPGPARPGPRTGPARTPHQPDLKLHGTNWPGQIWPRPNVARADLARPSLARN